MAVPKVVGAERFTELMRAGAEAFIRNGGYRRTQMSDVARLMGVAPGTLYLYVEGKAALFDLVTRHVDDPESFVPPEQLPVPNPNPDDTVAFVRQRVAFEPISVTLRNAPDEPPADPYAEAETIFCEIFATFQRLRWSIKVLDVSAREYPELAAVWFTHGKQRLLKDWGEYLARRTEQGCFAPLPDPHLAAYFMMEVVMCWAVHKAFDPTITLPDPEVLYETALQFAMSPLQAKEVKQ
jgi:AcrR family transcriptional regulator